MVVGVVVVLLVVLVVVMLVVLLVVVLLVVVLLVVVLFVKLVAAAVSSFRNTPTQFQGSFVSVLFHNPSRCFPVSDNDGITDAIERGCKDALCDKQNACALTAYWDPGNVGPCGNDNNKNWCDNHGSDSVNCPMNKGQSSTAHG